VFRLSRSDPPIAMSAVAWRALVQSAKIVAVTNGVGFLATAVTQSHKVTDLTGTAAFAASAWTTHAAAARCAPPPAALADAG
jgi:hypothetical protein